jgi:hypothetical protein
MRTVKKVSKIVLREYLRSYSFFFIKWNSIFTILYILCQFSQNLSKDVVMGINGLKAKRKPHLLGRPMFCSWWRIPIHSGPLPGITCPLLTFQSPLTPSHPFSPYCITMTTSATSVFLSGTIRWFL